MTYCALLPARATSAVRAVTNTAALFVVTLLCSTMALRLPKVMTLLEYRRAAVLQGQWWRLLTGQLVHLSAAHAVLNLAGIALLGIVGTQRGRDVFPLVQTTVLMSGTSLGLLIFAPEVAWYRGASGYLHGALLMLLVGHARAQPWAWAAVALLLGKVCYESLFGSLTSAVLELGGAVVTQAHAAGIVTGLLILLAARVRERLWPRQMITSL